MNMPTLTRRNFLQVSGTLAGGLAIGLPLAACDPKTPGATKEGAKLGYYVRIEPDESIVIGAPSTEMGQGINTAQPTLIAEELDADWSRVRIEQLPLMITRREDGEGYRFVHFPQGAGGSSSMIDAWAMLREAGARARRLLVRAAAEEWKIPAAECTTEPGRVLHAKSGRALTYGELAAKAAALADEEAAPPLKARAQYRIVGTPLRNAQAEAIATGQPIFGIDAEVPGMLYATVLRAPQFDSAILGIDDSAARTCRACATSFASTAPNPTSRSKRSWHRASRSSPTPIGRR